MAAVVSVQAMNAGDSARDVPLVFEKVTVAPIPGRIQFGFWPNYGLEPQIVADLGRRPIYRIGFTNWNRIEKKKGRYSWNGVFDAYQQAHRCGGTVVASINLMWSREVSPGSKHAIPSFYPPRITEPAARNAAQRFIRAYVKELLNRVGSVYLVFDYEFVWNYQTRVPKHREEYRDWYVEACGVARQTAAQMGKSELLRLVPIVNGNPLTAADKQIGGGPVDSHEPQQWLLDVVAASDCLGIDTYGHDPGNPASPDTTLAVIRFWRDNYAQGKPILVTENGFSSVAEEVPDYPRNGHHARGTEEEQAEYFAAVIESLVTENGSPSGLNGQVQAFCFWMYRDMRSKHKPDPLEHHFGLLRLDGSRKPAWRSVRDALDRYERKLDTAPWRETGREEVSMAGEAAAVPVAMNYKSGVAFDYLSCRGEIPAGRGGRYTLEIRMASSGSVLARLNGGQWLLSTDEASEHTIELPGDQEAGTPVEMDLWFTGAAYPFLQQVFSVRLSATD